MTGLTVSTAGSATPSIPGAASPLLTAGAPSGVPGLAAFLDMMTDQAAPAAVAQPALPERQGDAEPGKSLPDQDQDDPAGDPALAWLMSGLPGVAPQPLPAPLPKFQPGATQVAAAAPQDATAPQLPAIDPTQAGDAVQPTQASRVSAGPDQNAFAQSLASQPAPVPPLPAALPSPLAAPIDPSATQAAAIAVANATPTPQSTLAPAKPRDPTPVAVGPARMPAAPATATNNMSSVAISPVIASTARTATAQPAMFALATGRKEDRDSDASGSSAIAGTTLLQPADATKLIAQPGGAQGQSLDMSRQDWPQKMIDHIETLRDNADANDTSIRLKPEALGGIDVSIRSHADGAVSVKFTAEQPAARALIADAQPQLTAAAEARGIRLSGTSVDLANSGQGDNRPRPQAEAHQNTNNRLASSGDDIAAASGGRIA